MTDKNKKHFCMGDYEHDTGEFPALDQEIEDLCKRADKQMVSNWTDNHWDKKTQTCLKGKDRLSEMCILCDCKQGDGCPIWEDFIKNHPDYNQADAIKEAQEEYEDWERSGYFDCDH